MSCGLAPSSNGSNLSPIAAGPGGQFAGSCEQILPHSILGSLQEFKKEALARGDVQVGL